MSAIAGHAFAAQKGEPTVDLTKQHPLQYKWTLYFDTTVSSSTTKKTVSTRNWDENLKEITTIGSVEELWGTFNRIAEPSLLHPNSTYHLFKEGIKPKWEDEQNANGGKFTVKIKRGSLVTEIWMNTILLILGEAFEEAESDAITGVVLAIRKKEERIHIWTRTSDNRMVLDAIESLWRERMCEGGMPDNMSIEFDLHKDQQARHTGGYGLYGGDNRGPFRPGGR